MNNDKFNFYKTPQNGKKYLYFLAGVLIFGLLILSLFILPSKAVGYYYDSYSDPYYGGYSYGSDYGYNDDYSPFSYSYTTYSTPTYYSYDYDYDYGYDYGYDYDYGYSDYGYDYGYNYDYGYDYDYPTYSYGYSDYAYDYYPSTYYTYYQPTYSYPSYQPTSYYSTPQPPKQPRFNIFTPYVHEETPGRDYFLLDVKNETKYGNWGFPVSADPGDVLVFSVYYHNGVEGTVAKNTTLRVALPSAVAPYHQVTAYLWADNAENAPPSSPMTQSVGVNVSTPAKLEVMPGSVKWYPNQKDWRMDPATPFPFGQSGEELFGFSGLKIGDVIGCWEYSGYVIFKVKVGQPIPPTIDIIKKVRNVSEGQYEFVDSVLVKPGQRLEFQIELFVGGGSPAKNVFVRDDLPDKLINIPDSLRVNGAWQSGRNITYGFSLGDLNPGQIVRITFQADVREAAYFPKGDTNLINKGIVKADFMPEKQDTAQIIVRSICDPDIDYPGRR